MEFLYWHFSKSKKKKNYLGFQNWVRKQTNIKVIHWNQAHSLHKGEFTDLANDITLLRNYLISLVRSLCQILLSNICSSQSFDHSLLHILCCLVIASYLVINNYTANIYPFKINNRNTRKSGKICSQWRHQNDAINIVLVSFF